MINIVTKCLRKNVDSLIHICTYKGKVTTDGLWNITLTR